VPASAAARNDDAHEIWFLSSARLLNLAR
jgi:hypothetical protein